MSITYKDDAKGKDQSITAAASWSGGNYDGTFQIDVCGFGRTREGASKNFFEQWKRAVYEFNLFIRCADGAEELGA